MRFNILISALMLCLCNVSLAQQVTEDFNHGDRGLSRAYCWQIGSMDVSAESWSINSGVDSLMLTSSPLSSSTQLISPFVKFNGTGVINFKHSVNNLSSSPMLQLELVDLNGSTIQTLVTHSYTATATVSESIIINWTGVYQLRWEWSGSGGASRSGIDDITIHGSYASDSSQNNLGDCPAKSITQDTVCMGTSDVPYQIYSPVSSSQYNWFLSDSSAGSLDTSITANNQEIEVDWGNTAGTYALNVYEISSDGCIGDTVSKMIEIPSLPTVNLSGDSVCSDESASLHFNFSGSSPWIIEYTDGTSTFHDTCYMNSCSFSMPEYGSTTTIQVLSLEDANGCYADTAGLPSGQIYVFPQPSAALIYH